MTISPRHENSNGRLQTLLKEQGHQIWINSQEHGANGYQLSPIRCGEGKERQFIIDTFCRTPHGAMIAFEVDHNHETTEWKKLELAKLGIALKQASPGDIDLWVKEPDLLSKEISYVLKISAMEEIKL